MFKQPATVVLTTALLVVGLTIAPFAALGPAASTAAAQSDFTPDNNATSVVNPDGSIEGELVVDVGTSFNDLYVGDSGSVLLDGEEPRTELNITAQADESQGLVRFLVAGEVAMITRTETADGFVNDANRTLTEGYPSGEQNPISVDLEVDPEILDTTLRTNIVVDDQLDNESFTVDTGVEEIGNDATENLGVDLTIEDSTGTEAYSQSQTPGEIAGEEIDVPFDAVGPLEAGTYTATVTVTADNAETVTASDSFTVQEVGELAVSINESSTLEVREGESISVNADIENTGDVPLTQDITASVNGSVQDTVTNVSLAGGESVTETLTIPGNTAFDGQNVTVSSDDTSAEAQLTVSEVGELVISTLDAPTSANQSETIDVNATIENTGDVDLTQDVTFRVDDTVEATEQDVTLSGGEQQTVEFTYDIAADRQSDIDVNVTTANDSATQAIALNGLGTLTVDINETNSDLAVTDEENVVVNATLTNTGEIDLTQEITASVNGTDQTSQSVDLTAGATETIELTFPAEASFDEQDVTVSINDDNDSAPLAVDEVGELNVLLNASSTLEVREDENITAVVDVENTGDIEFTQDITADINGTEVAVTENLTVPGRTTNTTTFDIPVDLADDEETLTVSSNDTSDTAQLTVLDVGELGVTINETASSLDVNDEQNVSVNVTLENTGEATLNQTIVASVNGTDQTTADVSVASGTDAVTLEFAANKTFDGETVTVQSDDSNDTAPLSVAEVGELTVGNLSVPAGVNQSETININATITNTGETELSQNVTFTVDGEDVTTNENVTVANSSNLAQNFTYTVPDTQQTNLSVAVSTADDSSNETVPLIGLGDLTVEINETASTLDVTDEEDVVVNATLANTGEIDLTQNVTASVNSTDQTSQTVNLSANTTNTTTLTFPAAASFDGQSVTVSSNDDSDETALSVAEVGELDVSINGTSQLDVTDEDDIVVDVDVTNTGETDLTQNITATVNGDQQAIEEGLSVAAGETVQTTLTFDAENAFDGQNVTVSSGDTDATATLSVAEVGELAVDINETASELNVTEGENVTVAATVTNTGETPLTQDVTVDVNGTDETGATDVSVDAGTTTDLTFEFPAERDDDGEPVNVRSEDTMATAILSVAEAASGGDGDGGGDDDSSGGSSSGGGGFTGSAGGSTTNFNPADFEITSVEPGNVTVRQGETINVTVTVENIRGLEGETPLELRVNGSVVADGTVPVTTQGDVETLTFPSVDISNLEPGQYTYGAHIDGTNQTATVTIETADGDGTGDDGTGDDGTGDGTGDDGTGDGTGDDGTGDGTGDDGTGDGTGDDGTGDGTDGSDSTNDGIPGFSVIVTMLALLLAAGLLTRRQ